MNNYNSINNIFSPYSSIILLLFLLFLNQNIFSATFTGNGSNGPYVAGAGTTTFTAAGGMYAAISGAHLAGATTIRSASRDKRIWPISFSSLSEKRSSKTRSPLMAARDNGVINCLPPLVRMQRTEILRSRKRRITSKHL